MTAATQDATSSAVKDAYNGLKALIRRRFGGDPASVAALDHVERNPDQPGNLSERLEAIRADRDLELLEAAKALMAQLDPAGSQTGKYNYQMTGTTHVAGNQVVVVGDHNIVQQSGAPPQALTSLARSVEFQNIIRDRSHGFIGREFVFSAIDRAIAGEEFCSGYVVIHGEPGIGKTSVAAMLVVRGGYVHHFNVATADIRRPQQFLESVCAQLIVRYELDHATLPPRATEDGGFFSQLLSEAASGAEDWGALPVVLVIDALDEAEDTGLGAGANRLYLPRTLPDHVFIIITTREEKDYRLDVDNLVPIWIRDDDPQNLEDVAAYVRGFIASHAEVMTRRLSDWGITESELAVEISELSEGNFMYLVHVLREIASGRLRPGSVGSVKGLPRGLVGYYRRHWRDMKAADTDRFERLQRPVLCFLATSREPVTIEQLVQWTRLEPGDVRGVVNEWREFLNEDEGPDAPLYRIYHRSFAEFLDEEEDLSWYHAKISTIALGKIPGLRR